MDNLQSENFDHDLEESVNLLQRLDLSAQPKVPKKRPRKRRTRRKSNPGDRLLRAIEYPSQRYCIPPPVPISAETSLLGLKSLLDKNMLVEYKPLQAQSAKYKMIKELFPPSLNILNIYQVFNPFIKLSFQLKQHFFYSDVTPMKLFHGTKLKYVHSICSYNFDWRYNGAERGHKWGKGVNFTPKPKFAMKFCDRNGKKKVVIFAEVLVIKKTIGSRDLDVPPEGYDTTIREDNKTFVKFCDAEFNPQYVIYFCKRKD